MHAHKTWENSGWYCRKHNCYYFDALYYDNVLPLHRLNQKAATDEAKLKTNIYQFFLLTKHFKLKSNEKIFIPNYASYPTGGGQIMLKRRILFGHQFQNGKAMQIVTGMGNQIPFIGMVPMMLLGLLRQDSQVI